MEFEDVEKIKEKYQEGEIIICDFMDDPRPVKSGTEGVILAVDDIGTIHCRFEGGRQLGLIMGVDRFHLKGKEDKDNA